jgi:hypothetical protein
MTAQQWIVEDQVLVVVVVQLEVVGEVLFWTSADMGVRKQN